MPKSHPINDLHFWSHANNLPLRARIFCSCRTKMKKTNSIKDVDPLMKNALETRLNPHFSQQGGWNSAGAITAMSWFLFSFILGVAQTSWTGRLTFIYLSITFVVSCRFLRCFSYMRKTQVNFLTCKWLHDPWQRIRIQIKPKIALKFCGYGYPCWARKPATLTPVETQALALFLWNNQRASAWNITSLCLLSYFCPLLKTFDASLNLRGWISQFFDIIKNNIQTWPLVIFLN